MAQAASLAERRSTMRLGAGLAFIVLALCTALLGAFAVIAAFRSLALPFGAVTAELSPAVRVITFLAVLALGYVYFRWLCIAMIRAESDVQVASTGAFVFLLLTMALALFFFFPTLLPLETIAWAFVMTALLLAGLIALSFVLGSMTGWGWTATAWVLAVLTIIVVYLLL